VSTISWVKRQLRRQVALKVTGQRGVASLALVGEVGGSVVMRRPYHESMPARLIAAAAHVAVQEPDWWGANQEAWISASGSGHGPAVSGLPAGAAGAAGPRRGSVEVHLRTAGASIERVLGEYVGMGGR
jgi:hypothetical protein